VISAQGSSSGDAPTVPEARRVLSIGSAKRSGEIAAAGIPHEATYWTARAMAAACGLAVSTVQEIWKRHGLAPHR